MSYSEFQYPSEMDLVLVLEGTLYMYTLVQNSKLIRANIGVSAVMNMYRFTIIKLLCVFFMCQIENIEGAFIDSRFKILHLKIQHKFLLGAL